MTFWLISQFFKNKNKWITSVVGLVSQASTVRKQKRGDWLIGWYFGGFYRPASYLILAILSVPLPGLSIWHTHILPGFADSVTWVFNSFPHTLSPFLLNLWGHLFCLQALLHICPWILTSHPICFHVSNTFYELVMILKDRNKIPWHVPQKRSRFLPSQGHNPLLALCCSFFITHSVEITFRAFKFCLHPFFLFHLIKSFMLAIVLVSFLLLWEVLWQEQLRGQRIHFAFQFQVRVHRCMEVTSHQIAKHIKYTVKNKEKFMYRRSLAYLCLALFL